MPNHVTNHLTISGVSKERLAEILSAVKGKGVDEEGQEILFDFNQMIPMPPTLNIECSGLGGIGHAYLYPYEQPIGEIFSTSHAEAAKRYEELGEKEKAEARRLGELYHINYTNYGATTWYEWANEHWGTKWNAYDVAIEGNVISFTTAWATTYVVMLAMAEKFPDANFKIEYADEDMGHNCGWYEFIQGEAAGEFMPEGGSDEAIEFALRIKGLEGEYVKNEDGEWDWKENIESEKEPTDEETGDVVQKALDILKNDGVIGEN